ncbi:discoidin domain-containing protein [Nocardia sp. NPDC057440]|uniref:discoidin domain-containing protein n=1 Tax=Nocardia sp. NPDC057440 TaxID=3346134 RepID=UPI00366A9499
MTTVPQYTATTTTQGAVSASAPLHFDLNTNPDPVRISPSTGDPQRADFVLVGSRRSATPIECRKIIVTVPTGPNSPDLTPDLTSASAQISLPGWTPATNTAAKTITFAPTSGSAEIGRDQGVTVQLMGMRINTEIGSAPLRIDLEWREAGYDDPWETGTTVFDIGKFPPSFHVDNFMAKELIVDNGGTVKLNWEASGVSSLKLLYDVAEVNVLNMTTYTINNLSHTTVFYLRATVQVGNNTVERTLSTTVTVLVPDLKINNLTVLGEITMATPWTVNVGSYPGFDPAHPAENMLDGNLETFYKSKNDPIKNSSVQFDLGNVVKIDGVDVYPGDPNGNYRLPHTSLDTSVDGANWLEHYTFGASAPEFHYSFPASVPVRYIRLTFVLNSTGLIAIRSFQVRPPQPLRVTHQGADFGVPIIAHQGITER